MDRKEFIKTSAKTLVASAFLTHPFSKVMASNPAYETIYWVYKATTKAIYPEGANENTYEFYVYVPKDMITPGTSKILTKVFEKTTANPKGHLFYKAEYDVDYYNGLAADNPYMNLDQYTHTDDEYLPTKLNYLAYLTKIRFSKSSYNITTEAKTFKDSKLKIDSLYLVYTYHPSTDKYYGVNKEGVMIPKLDPNSDGNNPNDCFLTSTCVYHKGLADDCYELQTLRTFRDQYMSNTQYGAQLITEYYTLGPKTVAAIQAHPQREYIYNFMYTHLVQKAIQLIENNEKELAMEYYKAFTEQLYAQLH